MAIKSKGRGTAATFGLLLLVAGLIGGGLLFWSSVRRHDEAIEGFARAPVGCTTTLDFTETGTFFVYEEVGTLVEPPAGDCAPTAEPDEVFAFELSGPSGAVVPRRDDSIDYDIDGFAGRSVARLEITDAGVYEIEVRGDDEILVAAIGRDPDDGVDELRQRAIVVAIAGVALGLLLLLLAGRRSKRAAEFATPTGPGWGPRPPETQPSPTHPTWPPEAPRIDQVPVKPQEPDRPAPPPPSAPTPTPPAPPAPWAPPASGDTPVEAAPPSPAAMPPPSLPDARGRPSGTSVDADGTVHDESHPEV